MRQTRDNPQSVPKLRVFTASVCQHWFSENKQFSLILLLMHFTTSRRLAAGYTRDVITCDVTYSVVATAPKRVSFYPPNRLAANAGSHRRCYSVTMQIRKHNMFIFAGRQRNDRPCDSQIPEPTRSLHLIQSPPVAVIYCRDR